MRRLACLLALVGCVGDTTGADAGPDAGADVAPADVTQSDVTPPPDAGADGSDAASCPPPAASLTSGCTTTACLHATQITCGNPSQCTAVSGGRQLLCGDNSDCDGSACCVAAASVSTPGCPNVVSYGATSNIGTRCTTNTTRACPSTDVQVCLTTADCFSGTCQGAVFDINGMKNVKLGICQ